MLLYGTIFHVIKKKVKNIPYFAGSWGKKLINLILLIYLALVFFFSVYIQDFPIQFSIIVSIAGTAMGYLVLVSLDILLNNYNNIHKTGGN